MKIVKKLFNRLPIFLMRVIDANTYNIEKSVRTFASEIKPGSLVLDAGAGETPYRKYFEHCKYYSLDFAQGDSHWDYSKISVISDLSELPFKPGIIDAVICTQVLEHVKNPFKVTTEFSRILKANGRCLITAPQGWGEHQVPYDFFRYTEYGLRYLLETAGFKMASIIKSCGYFGYLGNRLTVLPKVLFWKRNIFLRIILCPLELIFSILFFIMMPMLLNALDFLDNGSGYTLNYIVEGHKKE